MVLAWFAGIAYVSSVPFFLTGIAKGKFPDYSAKWVLMDWNGIFFRNFNFVQEASNILIFVLRRVLV